MEVELENECEQDESYESVESRRRVLGGSAGQARGASKGSEVPESNDE